MSRQPDPQVAERRARVLTLRARGLTHAEIAKEVGLPDAAAAAVDLWRALDAQAKLNGQGSELEPTLRLERLSAMERACQWALATAQAAGDAPAVLAATDRLLRISEQRAAITQPVSSDELRRKRLGG